MECYGTFQSDKSSDLASKLQVLHTLWFAVALRPQSQLEAAVLLTEGNLRIDWDSEITSLYTLV